MIRRKLRKWLPSAESIRGHRWLQWCAPVLTHPRLWHLHRRAVALGVAIGLVTGLIPGPVQMLVAALIAIPLRANIPAAMFTTLYTNPFTFVPLYILAYNIGGLVTGGSAPLVMPPDIGWNWEGLVLLFPSLLAWIVSMGDTLLIGLAIQCTAFAIGGYALTMVAWRILVTRAWHARHARRARATP
ncbi:MAG TPA: DUF2062 domain-containing protein [Usitatibacteraceae bacterium]|nr:DUF2062 domain-containing protein [Usitatibacteraceae bacterium]